jgi:uroporphyrinogen decarboxylase
MAKRVARMSDRQRIEAILHREKPDRVPIWPWYSVSLATNHYGASIADGYNNPKVSLDAQRKAAKDFGWVAALWIGYAEWGGWEFGGDIKWPSGEFQQAPTVTRYPVETVEDVWNLKVPDPVQDHGIAPIQAEFYQLATTTPPLADNEPFRVYVTVGWPFTIAGNICGIQNLIKWTYKHPDAVHRLCRLATDYNKKIAKHWINIYGTKTLILAMGEASASNDMISPDLFKEFVLPYLKEEAEHLRTMGSKHIFCHPCGDQNGNLSHWAQVPLGDPGIISISQQVDIEMAAEYLPSHVILGNLEPSLIQVETPAKVYEETAKLVERGKKIPGGYIFAPGCAFGPSTPEENVLAVTRAVEDHGWYD